MRIRKRPFTAVALASGALALVAGCGVTTTGEVHDWAFFYNSLDSALASTQEIVRGTVVDVVPVSDDNGIDYVTATVDVHEVLAGDIGSGTVPVHQFGAESQDPGIPHLEKGSSYILFLEVFDFDSYQPCGPATGMYSIAAWGAWKQQDNGTFAWLSNSPRELPVHGYPSVLGQAEVSGLADRWARARASASPEDLCS